MTAAMEAMHRLLPEKERYPLPPREIAMAVAEDAGFREHLNESERTGFTLAAHFGYGAATGAMYAPLAQKNHWPPTKGGAGFGFAVWVASYLGILPAMGILTSATAHPARRNALMIISHVLWGVTPGFLVDRIDRTLKYRRELFYNRHVAAGLPSIQQPKKFAPTDP